MIGRQIDRQNFTRGGKKMNQHIKDNGPFPKKYQEYR